MNLPPAKTVNVCDQGVGRGAAHPRRPTRTCSGRWRAWASGRSGEHVQRPGVAASAVVRGTEIWVPLAGLIDVDSERARLAREADKVLGDLENTKKKLMNQDFLAKARPDVVQREKDRLELLDQTVGKLKRALEALSG